MIFEILFSVLMMVESGGNDKAYNKESGATGCVQITQMVLDDVNEHYGTHYTKKDCKNRSKSKEICYKYLSRHKALDSYENAARTWRGGPYGKNRKCATGYWEKCKVILDGN